MIFNMAGGVALNFSVKAYESALVLPQAARENTIAVITSTPIAGYTVCKARPEEECEGLVWICMDTVVETAFAATAKNPLMVYPAVVEQYVDGAWSKKEAYLYKNGAWERIGILYLYNKGDLCKSVTGGYRTLATLYGLSAYKVAPTATYNATNAVISRSGSEGGGVWVTVNKIDLTAYSTLRMVGELFARGGNSRTGASYLCTFTAVGSDIKWNENKVAYVGAQPWQKADETEVKTDPVVDISALTGTYYIGIGQFAQDFAYGTATIEKLYLE